MGKLYSPGDIIIVRNMFLKDKKKGNYSIDTRIKGHPFVVLNDIDDFGQTAQLFMCTGSSYRDLPQEEITSTRMLKKTYVNLNSKYEKEIQCILRKIASISQKELNRIEAKYASLSLKA